MLNNYVKTAWRGLTRNKLYSLINMAGLAVGMTVSFLLLLYVHHEYSYDRFNTNGDRLYLVFKNQSSNGVIRTKSISPEPLAEALKKDIPGIANTARTTLPENNLISYQEKRLKTSTIAADASLADMFSFDFIYGDKEHALAGSSGIVLTQSLATALFGKVNPMGRVVRFNNEFPLTVSAVIKDNPANSSLSFKAMISWEAFLFQRPWMKDAGWDNFLFPTYVLLQPRVGFAGVNQKIKNFLEQKEHSNKGINLFLYPLTKLHLYNGFQNGVNTGGRIGSVRLFLILAIGIIMIACINFMNLSTARSEKRAREVGVRKTMGARRFALVRQFMTESLIMSLLAFVAALVLLIIFLPVFDRMVRIPLALPYGSGWAWLAALGITVFTGVMAGSYPAFFLSSFNPVKVLKGQLRIGAGAVRPRQVLVVTQFSFAICLILFSIFIYKQIGFIKDLPVGYDRGGLVETSVDGKLNTLFDDFRKDAIASGAVTNAAMISAPITNNQSGTWGVIWPGQLPGEDKIVIDCFAVTYHFTETYGIKLEQGRDFDSGRPADSAGILLNEAAVKTMRLDHPLGQDITWQGSKRKVIGVVKNFVWGSPYEPVKPVLIGFVKDWTGNIGLRLNPHMPVSKSLALLEGVYKKYNPAYPFEYTFTDESFGKKFGDEQLLGILSLCFTSLAIFISCLGLFGLASFAAEQRKREMGIRKVLGASVGSLWFRLSGEFVRLVIISFILSSAISWYGIHRWLSSYTFHVSLSVWVFVATMGLSIALCLIAVSGQAIKAAWANPVDSLRNE